MAFRVKQRWSQMVRGGDGKIASQFGIDPLTARVLLNRGINEEGSIRRFLHGTLEDLEDPRKMDQASEAVSLLHRAIQEKKKIRIFGDYDADGILSTYILYHTLEAAGASVSYAIPDRVIDGFGMSLRMVEEADQDDIGLIITCDNGITQTREASRARQLGMVLIITDHHEANYTVGKDGEKQYTIPDADAVVDPKKPGCGYPNQDLCGAGVAWKLMYLYEMRYMSHAPGPASGSLPLVPVTECPVAMENLPFAAAATVTDVMNLSLENRILVREGLSLLSKTRHPGMRALIRACGLEGKALTTVHVGFVIGPCLNASGRLKTARQAVDLLLEKDLSSAERMAEQLSALNEKRKQMTEDGKSAAFEMIETSSLIQDRVLIVYLKGIHESVAGIIASKVKETYHRPVIIFTDTQDPGHLKGSGRSIESYNMHDELSALSGMFLKFGGHAMAAGVTIERERLEELRYRINEACMLQEEDLAQKVLLDAVIPFSYLSEGLIDELACLEPYGPGNPAPLFGCSKVRILRARILGKNQNCVRLLVSDGSCVMTAVYFGDAAAFFAYLKEKWGEREVALLSMGKESAVRISLAYRPVINEYRGERSMQLQIAHFQ
ncbi:MAG TPA: single-stranded-DNA-specific exonuclease RecJ [Lachnospiraceae bacterium]|nr:single-stranded-DNA-specific exonuclease RecJ [Lachnospiraceae bacterium]